MCRVTHLTSVHPPFDTRIFHKEAKSLVKAGYSVSLIVQHVRHEIIDGIELLPLPPSRKRLLRMLLLVPLVFILALREKAALYHLHDPELLPVGLLLKLVTRAKVVYDAHEDYAKLIGGKTWIPFGIGRSTAWLFDRVERFAAHFLDGIIAATESIAQRFPASKTTVIHNFPFLPSLDLGDQQARHDDEHLTMIYVGILTRRRGVLEMIRLLELIDRQYNVDLRLIGRFTDEKFARRVASLEQFRGVDFRGWLPYSEVLEELQNADIGMCVFHPSPNHTESMPNKLFEYMSVSLPVIASNFPLWVEIVEGNDCGLIVDPLEVDEIARAVELLAAEPSRRREMGKNGRQAVIEKYNWQVEAGKLSLFYQRLLHS